MDSLSHAHHTSQAGTGGGDGTNPLNHGRSRSSGGTEEEENKKTTVLILIVCYCESGCEYIYRYYLCDTELCEWSTRTSVTYPIAFYIFFRVTSSPLPSFLGGQWFQGLVPLAQALDIYVSRALVQQSVQPAGFSSDVCLY